MRILVCIDDTDNLESQGTGELASAMADFIESSGWGNASYITRHQLLVHPDIPYTSHNSSMAFFADISPDCLEKFTLYAAEFLARESAEGSDPGLCIVDFEKLGSGQALLDFGVRAKEVVLDIDEAYRTARILNIHLSEHGGTGQGVIGALAGAGLRLGGNDGRLRGRLSFDSVDASPSVAQLLAHPGIDVVRSQDGEVLAPTDSVQLQDKVKTVLLDGQAVLLVEKSTEGQWRNLSRQKLKCY